MNQNGEEDAPGQQQLLSHQIAKQKIQGKGTILHPQLRGSGAINYCDLVNTSLGDNVSRFRGSHSWATRVRTPGKKKVLSNKPDKQTRLV